MGEREKYPLTEKLLKSWVHLRELEERYQIPSEDILLIALNASGVSWNNISNDRIRFPVHLLDNGHKYFFALTVTDSPLSNFSIEEEQGEIMLKFEGEAVGEVPYIEFDTCIDSYWRKGKAYLTLNTNSRSKCRGCKFCGTYSLEDKDDPLTEEEALNRRAQLFANELGGSLESLDSIGIVTACFPSEEKLFSHLLMVRKVFSNFGFRGEIRYIGSQLRNREYIKEVISSGPFSYYLTVEVFTRREELMKRVKSSLSLEEGRVILGEAKALGADTSFLYIVGLDPLEKMQDELPKYREVITRFPNAQIFQVYTPTQMHLRDPEAYNLDYFLRARLIFEDVYPELTPDRYSNYRGLWYSSYRGEDLSVMDILP